jgi:hypothetical protein
MYRVVMTGAMERASLVGLASLAKTLLDEGADVNAVDARTQAIQCCNHV